MIRLTRTVVGARGRLLRAVCLGLLAELPALAHAGGLDLNLGRLSTLVTDRGTLDTGAGYNPSAGGKILGVIPHNGAFRSLMSELGVVFAPNIMSPASTQGYNGFNVSAELGWTRINPQRTAQGFSATRGNQTYAINPHWYWRAARSVDGNAFASGQAYSEAGIQRIENGLPDAFLPTLSVMVRKGLWFPVPSFELGVGVRYLVGSQMWAPMATAKIALFEGFERWPIPAFAVRGTGVRVMGTQDFNLTIAGLDFSLSKRFGVAGTFNMTPYAGYQLLWIIADSAVIDATPHIDAVAAAVDAKGGPSQIDPQGLNTCPGADCNALFTFDKQSNILRHRAFFGLKVNIYVASLLLEYSLFPSGSTTSALPEKLGVPVQPNVADDSGLQHNLSFALALDY